MKVYIKSPLVQVISVKVSQTSKLSKNIAWTPSPY